MVPESPWSLPMDLVPQASPSGSDFHPQVTQEPPGADSLVRHVSGCFWCSWMNLVDSGTLISSSHVQEGFMIRCLLRNRDDPSTIHGKPLLHLHTFIQREQEIWRERNVQTCRKRAPTRMEPALFQTTGPPE